VSGEQTLFKMSVSQPKLENPCKKFIDFHGKTGKFTYFDKSKGEKGENVELVIDKGLYFIVLDELSSITGFNEKNQCGIYSNEVHYLNEEILTVKTFKGNIKYVGKYADIKNDIKAIGGKFCKSVYAMLLGVTPELVCFNFYGASFASWMDKKFDTNKFCVLVNSFGKGKKGNNEYLYPEFKALKLPDAKKALWDQAIEMDKVLQNFFVDYKANKASAAEEVTEVVKEQEDEEVIQSTGNSFEPEVIASDDLPF
jgi:hypothetical protein